MTDGRLDKIKGSFLLGACGDALGAPLEAMRNFRDIIEKFGDEGLSEIIEFKNAYEEGLDYPAGRVTDDTTMAMTTAAAMIMAAKDRSTDFDTALKHHAWQGYINWAQHQDNGDRIKEKVNEEGWPDLVRDFWFACGAGRGTIAALMQKEAGSVDMPLNYDCEVRGKKVRGPNSGCGGMMRVVPLAFLNEEPERIFEIACDNAALTHGKPEAFVASGVVALYTRFASEDMSAADIVSRTLSVLDKYKEDDRFRSGVKACRDVMEYAFDLATRRPHEMLMMENLPKFIGYKNPFLALPVLAQVTYAIGSVNEETPDLRKTVALSANHSGDSDSVAAIVGNILGAKYGAGLIPRDWLAILMQRTAIEYMAVAVHDMNDKTDYRPQRKPGIR